jgi:CubicO group peptidase (beta-lactamase class C family)
MPGTLRSPLLALLAALPLLAGIPTGLAAQRPASQQPASRQPAPEGASRTRAGFSVERLARIDSAFAGFVARGEIAGAVVLVERDGQRVYERAFGWADREAGRRMTTDVVFRIASQTKALTSVAVMMLAEGGSSRSATR